MCKGEPIALSISVNGKAMFENTYTFDQLSREAQDHARRWMERNGLDFWDANDNGFHLDGTPHGCEPDLRALRKVAFLQEESAKEAIERIEKEGAAYLVELVPNDVQDMEFHPGMEGYERYKLNAGIVYVNIDKTIPTIDIAFKPR